MKTRFLSRLAIALILVAGSAAADPFRNFDGTEAALSDYVGQDKWTIVMLWASDCHICNEEAGSIDAFHRKHSDTDAIVLGVSLDGEAGIGAAKEFLQEHNVTFPNLIVEFGDAAALYRELTGRPWIGTPTFLVYGPDGKLLAQQVGAIETAVIESFMAANSMN